MAQTLDSGPPQVKVEKMFDVINGSPLSRGSAPDPGVCLSAAEKAAGHKEGASAVPLFRLLKNRDSDPAKNNSGIAGNLIKQQN